MTVTYVTYANLVNDVSDLATQLHALRASEELIGVVGIPRSGMLPAAMLAQHLDLPLGEFYWFVKEGCFMRSGERFGVRPGRPGKVLVLDDSIYKGTAMQHARTYAAARGLPGRFELLWGAVYSSPETPVEGLPDISSRSVPADRYFEWNLFNHPDLTTAMLDLDGVLCHDPQQADNDDGERYACWLTTAAPRYIPRVPLGAICTHRLEQYRPQTEAWLAQYGIRYGRLLMSPYPTAAARRAGPAYGVWKGSQYADPAFRLFLESDDGQALRIWQESGKPVICTTTKAVYQ